MMLISNINNGCWKINNILWVTELICFRDLNDVALAALLLNGKLFSFYILIEDLITVKKTNN